MTEISIVIPNWFMYGASAYFIVSAIMTIYLVYLKRELLKLEKL